MEITTQTSADAAELVVGGMLDSHWAEHLSRAIDEAIRAGWHKLLVNLAGVSYISSAGIASLVRAHQRLESIHGQFGVCEPSDPVRKLLRLTGLEQRLVREREAFLGQSRSVTAQQVRAQWVLGLDWEQYDVPAGEPMVCGTVGNPALLEAGAFTAAGCRQVPFDSSQFGLGLGAFGQGFDECRDRFGEFLAVGGAAVQLPGRSGAAPDYLLRRGSFIPQVQVLYALTWSGSFAHLARFDRPRDDPPVGLGLLARSLLELARSDLVAFVMVGEAAGLVGSALRRSPLAAGAAGQSLFDPDVAREALVFTPEHVFPHALVLAAGVAGRAGETSRAAVLAPFLRPLDPQREVVGHCHAAVFPYRPLKKRYLELASTVELLFEAESVLGLLHLLGDFRDVAGAGESEFHNAACWFAKIDDVNNEG